MSTILDVARAEALFLAPVARGTQLDRATADQHIRQQLLAHGGIRGCAGDMAAEFGRHPHEAAARMNWALYVVAELYGTNGHHKAA